MYNEEVDYYHFLLSSRALPNCSDSELRAWVEIAQVLDERGELCYNTDSDWDFVPKYVS